jgi:hypothetical protein
MKRRRPPARRPPTEILEAATVCCDSLGFGLITLIRLDPAPEFQFRTGNTFVSWCLGVKRHRPPARRPPTEILEAATVCCDSLGFGLITLIRFDPTPEFQFRIGYTFVSWCLGVKRHRPPARRPPTEILEAATVCCESLGFGLITLIRFDPAPEFQFRTGNLFVSWCGPSPRDPDLSGSGNVAHKRLRASSNSEPFWERCWWRSGKASQSTLMGQWRQMTTKRAPVVPATAG